MDQNNILAFINILLYLIFFVIYQRKVKYFGANSFILVLYIITTIMGLLYINNSFATYEDLKFFPYLYLFVMLILINYPLLRINEGSISNIILPKKQLFLLFCWFVIAVKLLYFIEELPNLSNNLAGMFQNSTSIIDNYDSNYERAATQGYKSFNVLAIVSNLFSNISILLLMYYLTIPKRNLWMTIGLIFSTIFQPLQSLSIAQRGSTVIFLILLICCYLFFRNFYSVKIKKIVRVLMVFMAAVLIIPFVVITSTRFGDEGRQYQLFNIVDYSGQSTVRFNNYALYENGTRNGTRTATLITTIISSGSPRSYDDRVAKFHYMKLDETNFSTFVGDFVLDYGPYVALLIFIIFAVFFRRRLLVYDQIYFHQLILWFLLINITTGLFLFTFSDWGGNLGFLALLGFYYLFKYGSRIKI